MFEPEKLVKIGNNADQIDLETRKQNIKEAEKQLKAVY